MPGRPSPASEVDEELEFHLAMMTDELVSSGLSRREARRKAEETFGDLEATRRYCKKQDESRKRRRMMGGSFRSLRDEFTLASRTLVRNPGSVLAPVLILAVAVSLNALVLSVVRGVLLAPLPFQNSDRVVVLEERAENGGISMASYPVIQAWRKDARQAEAISAYLNGIPPIVTSAGPAHVDGAMVASGFFELLEDPIRLGRPFTPGDHIVGSPPVIAISEGLWKRAFGSDPKILDQTVKVEGEEHQIVAVVRDQAAFPDGAQVWIPMEPANPDLMEIAGAKIIVALARLRPGVGVQEVGREMGEISAQVEGGAPSASAVRLEDRLLGDVRTPLLLLQGAVFLVLLAAAVNAGSLLLARGVRRRGEIALRGSLGAGSARVAGSLLMEGLLLGAGSGVAGLLLAALALGPALALVPMDLPRAAQIGLDPTVAFVAMLLASATGVATALLPALSSLRTSPADTLRESGQTGSTPPWIRGTLEGFVVAQVGLAVVLTAGAGLLIRSFITTIQEDPGFDPAGITLLDLSLPEFRYPDQSARINFAQDLLSRAGALPGAEAVALGRNLPISGVNMTSPLMVEGFEGMTKAVQVVTVTAGYFDVMGIPLEEGNGFGGADRPDGPLQMMVGPGVESPEGAPVTLGSRAHSFFGDLDFRDVVGVVGPVRHGGLRVSPVPMAYEPFFQKGGATGFTLLVRSTAPTGVVAREVRNMVQGMDPELAVDQISTMSSRISRSLAEPRFYTVVLSVFGVMAVLLALAGCQAGLAHRVASRRREIGIRMALGAPQPSVRGMILRRGLFLTSTGIILGLLVAVPGTRVLRSQLYGVTLGDPLTYGLLLLIFIGAGALASDLPARQAASLDPADVLREG